MGRVSKAPPKTELPDPGVGRHGKSPDFIKPLGKKGDFGKVHEDRVPRLRKEGAPDVDKENNNAASAVEKGPGPDTGPVATQQSDERLRGGAPRGRLVQG